MNRAMFRGLNNLQSLSLYGNLISCVTPGAFDELTSMTSLNLISNPFNCNCHMAWFADWLRRRSLTNSGPRCVKPVHLKNKAIHSLATHEFRCTSKLINSQFKICLSLHRTHTVSQFSTRALYPICYSASILMVNNSQMWRTHSTLDRPLRSHVNT